MKVATINTPLGCFLEIFELIDNKLVNQIRDKYKVAQLVHHVGVVEYGSTLPPLQDRQLLVEKELLEEQNCHEISSV